MFNITLKKEALRIHEETLRRYNASYEKMRAACENLYRVRRDSVGLIQLIERAVNSIANTPKEFDTQMGKAGKELTKFSGTEEYAKESYYASIKAGVNIVGGAAAGVGVAAMAPTALMSVATTFGTATTGTAISALSGAAAQKAAMAWIGRTFAGFAVKEGAGMVAGQAFLALAGPIGWGITITSTGISLVSLTARNKEISDNAVNEAKEIAEAREALDEAAEKVDALKIKTSVLYNEINRQRNRIAGFMNTDYQSLAENDQYFLGTLVNNTLSLSMLLNETVE